MRTTKYELAVVQTRRSLTSLDDAAERLGLHPEVLHRFVEFGLLEPVQITGEEIMFDPITMHRIQVIQRLRYDLGVNLAGIGVILDLLDRIDVLQRARSSGL